MDSCANAYQYHREGYNCAQSVVAAFLDKLNLTKEQAMAMAGGFGGGVGGTHCEMCGAVSGAVLVLSLLGYAGFWFYHSYYTQMINGLSVEGSEDVMTVRLDTQIEEDLLTVVCTDTNGNSTLQPVENGIAQFDNLLPDMLYKIKVEIDGFHRLTGSTTHEYLSPAETTISDFTAVTGPEDGSAILNFTVNGPDSDEWTAICTAEDAETLNIMFTGHMTTITGLNVGSTYQIRLIPTTRLYIPGSDSLEFTASSIIIAENLTITSDGMGNLTVAWAVPDGAQVGSWDVRCYSTDGYDRKQTTDQLTATFQGISSASAYTVEVTAAGMTQPARTSITKKPIVINQFTVTAEEDSLEKITVHGCNNQFFTHFRG